MNQLVKDHKDILSTRPVCRAQVKQAPNGPLSSLVCEILNPFVEEADKERRTNLKSTEELCHEFTAANQEILKNGVKRGPYQKCGSLIIGSKDVKCHYPSIDIDVVAEEAKLEVEESDIEIEMNTEEVALFLACTMSQDEINTEGLSHVVHKRRYKNGSRPGLTCEAITGGPKVRSENDSWIPPARKPTRRQKKKMLGCLIRTAIRLVMKNHFYSFDNEIRNQRKGGAIGNKLTERCGKLLMKRHDKKYLKLLSKLKIENELFERYVDDTTDGLVALDPGVRFIGKKLVKSEELIEEDKNVPEDQRTMNVLRDIGNTIYKCVQFTIDCSSLHPELKKVPVLDLQVYVEENQFKHEFYEKPVASKFVIPYSSAHSRKMKMGVLVEEGLRRLRNCSRGLDWEVSRKVMTKWSMKLRRSGYPATIRHQVIKTAGERWDRMCQQEDSRVRPIHRSRYWKAKERAREKEMKITNWHKSQANQVSAPLIVDPTAGNTTSEMREVCRKFEAVTGMRVAVLERAGDSVKHIAKAEPLRIQSCGRNECFPCQSGGGKCEKNGTGYRIVCLTCQAAGKVSEYEGETGRNGYTRGAEHLSALRLEDEENALWKHCQIAHDGTQAEFSMKVLKVHRTPMVRQINEAVRIIISKAECLLNSKSEWHQAPLVRVIPVSGLQEDQGAGRGSLQQGGEGRGRGGGHQGVVLVQMLNAQQLHFMHNTHAQLCTTNLHNAKHNA